MEELDQLKLWSVETWFKFLLRDPNKFPFRVAIHFREK
jgi:hypothetical protein